MNHSKLLLFLIFLFFLNCKKDKSTISKDPEQAILGEWTSTGILNVQKKKLIFYQNGIYSMYLRSGSDSTWNLIHDSLKYSVDQKSISLEDEEDNSNPHKLTHLNEKALRYEVISRSGNVNPRSFIRE